jgi:hypothetical protein
LPTEEQRRAQHAIQHMLNQKNLVVKQLWQSFAGLVALVGYYRLQNTTAQRSSNISK